MPAFGRGDIVCASLSSSAVQMRTVLLPVSSLALALSTWIFFASRFSKLGSQRVPTGNAHLVLVKPSLQRADKGSAALHGEQDGCEAGVGWPSPAR